MEACNDGNDVRRDGDGEPGGTGRLRVRAPGFRVGSSSSLGPGDGAADRDAGGVPELRLLGPAASTGDLMPADSFLGRPCCRGCCHV